MEGGAGLPQALLYVPMQLGDDFIGVLGVSNITVSRPFNEHNAALLGALCDYASIALSHANHITEVQELEERLRQLESAPPRSR